MRRLLFFLVIACLLALPAAAQSGDTLVVRSGGPYETIEAALAAATNGDTIDVYGGTYTTTPLVIDKSVAIIGHEVPVIDGQGDGSLVVIDAPDVRFQGFTLRNTGTILDHEDSECSV